MNGRVVSTVETVGRGRVRYGIVDVQGRRAHILVAGHVADGGGAAQVIDHALAGRRPKPAPKP